MIFIKALTYGSFFFLVLTGCSKKDDVEQIRQIIQEGATLAEEHDISGLMKLTADDFQALPGRHNRAETKKIIWLVFRHYGPLRIVYPEPTVDVDVKGRTAVAKLYFLIVKKGQSLPKLKDLYKDPKRWIEKVGEQADLYQLTLKFVKSDDDWLVKQAQFSTFQGFGFNE